MDVDKSLDIYGLPKDRLLLVRELYDIGLEAEPRYFISFKKDHISFQCIKVNNRVLNCVCINPKLKKLKISFHLSPYGDYDNKVCDLADRYKLIPYRKNSGRIESGIECNGWYAFHIEEGSIHNCKEAIILLFKEAYLYNSIKK